MAKNPLLNKQALPGSYADYLTRGQNAHAAAGANNFNAIIANNDKIANSPVYDDGKYNSDVVMYKGTTPGVSTPSASPATAQTPYEIWEEMYGKQAQLMPTQSYTDWLMAGGMSGAVQKQYDAIVRSAETDYEKSKALYGANAERLGRAGLTGSGYTDYLTGAGFSAMQGAKVAAADTKALTEAQQRSDYESYLKGVQQTNAQLKAQADAANQQSYAQYLALGGEAKGVVDQKMLAGESDEAIKAYIQQHYGNQFDSQLDGWITGAHSYNDPIIAETNAAKTEAAEAETLERAQKANQAYATYAELGGEAARTQMLADGFTEQEVATAASHYSSLVASQIAQNIELNSTTLETLKSNSEIQDAVAAGYITQDQADDLKARAEMRREKLLDKKYDSLTNDTAPGFISQVHSLYKSGEISRETFAKYAANLVAENVASVADDAAVKEPVYEIAAIISDIKNDDKYNDIEDDLINKILANVQIGVDTYNSRITFDVGGKKEKIGLVAASVSDEERQSINNTLGTGEPGSMKVVDGVLWKWAGDRFWQKITGVSLVDVGTPEYASIIYDMLLAKYK